MKHKLCQLGNYRLTHVHKLIQTQTERNVSWQTFVFPAFVDSHSVSFVSVRPSKLIFLNRIT